MNVIVVLHNNGVALVTQSKEKVNTFLTELIGNSAIVVDGEDDKETLSSIDALYDLAEQSGDVGESLTCYFGEERGDDYCELAITMREVE